MALISGYDFESLTLDSPPVDAAPWNHVVGTANNVTAAAAIHGTKGWSLDDLTSFSQLRHEETISTGTRVYCHDFVLRAAASAVTLGALNDSATNRADWRINANRTITLRNAGAAIVNDAVVLDLDTHYHAEWRIPSSGDQELRIFAGDSGTLVTSLSGEITNITRTDHRFGSNGAASGTQLYLDDLAVHDTWVRSIASDPPTLDAPDLDDAVIVTATATAGGGGALSYSISQLTGTTIAPVNISLGVWAIPRDTTAATTYRITVTETGGGTDTEDIIVAKVGDSGGYEIVVKVGGTWT